MKDHNVNLLMSILNLMIKRPISITILNINILFFVNNLIVSYHLKKMNGLKEDFRLLMKPSIHITFIQKRELIINQFIELNHI